MSRFNFTTYRAKIDAGRYDSTFNCARIDLDGVKGTSARLYFSHDTTQANQPARVSGSRQIAHFHISYFDRMIDMLRNEDSCYLWFNVGANLVYLATGDEDMGEEES